MLPPCRLGGLGAETGTSVPKKSPRSPLQKGKNPVVRTARQRRIPAMAVPLGISNVSFQELWTTYTKAAKSAMGKWPYPPWAISLTRWGIFRLSWVPTTRPGRVRPSKAPHLPGADRPAPNPAWAHFGYSPKSARWPHPASFSPVFQGFPIYLPATCVGHV